MVRQVPKMTTDEEAEALLEQDLSDLDFSEFKRTRLKFRRRDSYFASGVPAPRAGIYRNKIGTRGDTVGEPVAVSRGNPLPPATEGGRWVLIEAVHEAAEE